MSITNDWIFRKEFIEENNQIKNAKVYRCKSVWFVEDLANAAGLERKVATTAAVYFHRFYLFHSFGTHDRFFVAVACLFLAAKVEENAIRLKDLIVKYYQVRHRCDGPSDVEVKDVHKNIVLLERIILNTLNYDLYIEHPHIHCTNKIKTDLKMYIPEASRIDAVQTAINFVNDSYRSTLCLQYPPNQIALGMIYLSLIVLTIRPVSSSNNTELHWIDLLSKDIDHQTLKQICFELLDMYDNDLMKSLKIQDKVKTKELIHNDLRSRDEDKSGSGSNDYLDSISDASPKTDSGLTPSHSISYFDTSFGTGLSGSRYSTADDLQDLDPDEGKRQPKVTVTHVRSSSISSYTAPAADLTPPPPPPPSDSPALSVSSSEYQSHSQYSFQVSADETPMHLGDASSFSVQETPDQTPQFSDLPRLPARERAASISDNEPNSKRQKRD